MKADNQYFMVSVDLLTVRNDVENLIEGLKQGIVRIELVSTAMKSLIDASQKLYKLKQSPARLCDCGCGREATIAAYAGCT